MAKQPEHRAHLQCLPLLMQQALRWPSPLSTCPEPSACLRSSSGHFAGQAA